MARFFITGSSDGLGALTAKRLIAQGHQVVLHARNAQRAKDAEAACPGSLGVVIGDLTSLDETRAVAAEADALGPYAGIAHNAGMYTGSEPGKSGLPSLFCTNVLAPYMLSCLMKRPERCVLFVSSGVHYSGRVDALDGEDNDNDKLLGCGYGDSKLYDVMLAKAFARRWPGVMSNAADPGWVPTKMGGSGAVDKLDDGVDTFVTVLLGQGAAQDKTGTYFVRSAEKEPSQLAKDEVLQEKLMSALEKISGVSVRKD